MEIPQTRQIIQQGLESGLHIGAQLYVSLHGKPIVDTAFGLSRLGGEADTSLAGTPMQPDTLMIWLSAGKPLTAVAIALLAQRGRLHFDDPVAHYIPEFAQNGKDAITIRHLLTHTAGIRALDTQYPFLTWDETLAKLFALKPERDWVPGEKAGYHAHSTWYILGELIGRIDGRPCDQFLREEIFLPLAMTDTFLSMPIETYHAYGPRIGFLHDTAPTTAEPPKPLPNYDTPLAASRPRPSASVRGPIRQLGFFYEMMLRALAGKNEILTPDTARLLVAPQRTGMFDVTFRHKIDWGLGFILNSSHHGPAIPYQFGPHASPSAFGHGGSQCAVGMADPFHQLVVALIFNGCPGEPAHDRRLRATLKALYEDLALAR